MTLRIITGTIIDARDPFGVMQRLYKRGIFTRWRLTEHGWEQIPTRIFSGLNGSPKFSIIQTTGSGKTVLAVLYAYQAHSRGVKVGGNLSLRWTKNNEGRQKKDWQPIIQCMDDIEAAKFMHITLDDIRGTITAWNTKDAKMVSEVANATRKKGNYIDITTQRMVFVPPDMRQICDEIIVPFIRCVDGTRRAPDGRDVPLEISAFRFSAGNEFLDYKSFNIGGETGNYILDSYDTLQIASRLKDAEGGMRINQPGAKGEIKLLDFLKLYHPDVELSLKNGKGIMDIESSVAYIDNVGITHDGRSSRLNTGHKNRLREHKDYCKLRKTPGWVAFWWHDDYLFLKIGSKYLLRDNPTITPALLAACRSHKSVFG